MLIDSHAHLISSAFEEDLEDVLSRAKGAGLEAIVNICTTPEELSKGLDLAEKYPWIHTVAATTPHDVGAHGKAHFPAMEEAARSGKLVAVGETGLDYYHHHSKPEEQKTYLIEYLRLAKSCSLPVVIHCRDAFADFFAIIDRHYASCPGVLHCFTGTPEEAREVIARGWYLSLSGIVTFKKSEGLREVARSIPISQLLIETDAPYLAPQSRRGKRNEPAFVLETATFIAALREIPLEELARATSENAKRLFSLRGVNQ